MYLLSDVLLSRWSAGQQSPGQAVLTGRQQPRCQVSDVL